MLLGFQPRNIHERCQALGHDRREGARVLMCDDSRYRPCRCSMLRRKRDAALEELAIAAALIGTLSSERILHSLYYHKAVKRRFPGKKPRLAPVFLVFGMAKKPHPACTAYQCGNGRIERLLYRLIVLGSCERLLLKSLSVTTNPAVKPLSGTSHVVSENRSRAGLVQILR